MTHVFQAEKKKKKKGEREYTAMNLLLVLACAASALLIIIRHKALKLSCKQPPGPPAWPIMGHLHLLGDLPHQSLCSLSKVYGPLMGLRLGRVPTIILSSPAMAKEILQSHDLSFAYRPPSAAGTHMFFNSSNMGFAPYGPYWRQLRQLFASKIFSSKRAHSTRLARHEEIRALTRSFLQTVQAEPRVPIEIRASLLATTCNINCRVALGKRITEISSWGTGKEEFQRLVEEVVHLMGVFYVGDFIPWLSWLDPRGYVKRMKLAGQKAHTLMQAMIDKRRKDNTAGSPSGDEDLLDALLHAGSQGNGISIPDDKIKAVLLDVAAGGADTASITVEWALADLLSNPKAMRKLQDELDRVVGKDRVIEESNIAMLPFLRAVVTESMRLHPVGPLLLPREAIQECHIGGYKIPRKTRAYINTWAIGRDPTIWERSLDFWPERFQTNNEELRRQQSFELLPFGFGRRKCPAWEAGLLNAQLMVGALVQGFSWSLVSSNIENAHSYTQCLDMSERFGLALTMAKPLVAFATPRLPLHLY